MKVILRSQELVKELGLAQGVVDRKLTIPMRGNVLLEAQGEELTVTTTDLELAFRSSCRAKVAEEGAITVPMRKLFDYVRLLPGAEMSISSVSGDAIQIACGSAKTRIAGMDANNFPSLAEVPETVARVGLVPLQTALKRTIISVAGEQSHYTLAAAQLEVRRGSLGIVSTDGHRLSLYFEHQESIDATQEVQGLIGRKAMGELLKVLEQSQDTSEDEPGAVAFAIDENNMFFHTGRRLFICRKQTGKFPDYNRVMPSDLPVKVELDSERLGGVLRRVSQFSDERSRTVKFILEDNRLEIAAEVPDFGSSEESIDVEYDGDPVDVGFNAQYILEFLSVCGSEKVVVCLKDPRSAAQFQLPGQSTEKDPGQAAGQDYRYVIMPIRV